jgi:MoaA/NifB/PqqE/SkfB family radical SAM enzyme
MNSGQRSDNGGAPLSWLNWLRYGPFLAQLVVTRRCNLSCTYCFEFDKSSTPVPYDVLEQRIRKLKELRTWVVCLIGGEPTLHPDLVKVVRRLREMRFPRRQIITNGYRLTADLIEELNSAGLTDLQLSVDGVHRNADTIKVLDILTPRLETLARHARFQVTLNAVIGSAPPQEAIEVVEFARARGFRPRVLLIHDKSGRVKLSPEELAAYQQVKKILGENGKDGGDYRERLIHEGAAPFRCRAGSRYLYVDEFGSVRWCSQTRDHFSKPLLDYTLDDLRGQFHTPKSCNPGCSIGCSRTASAFDAWRPQTPAGEFEEEYEAARPRSVIELSE